MDEKREMPTTLMALARGIHEEISGHGRGVGPMRSAPDGLSVSWLVVSERWGAAYRVSVEECL